MFSFKRSIAMFALVAAAFWARPAGAAQPVLTFAFSELISDFSSGDSALFSAANVSQTSGDITRLDPLGTALFDGALATDFFSLTMELSAAPGGLDPADFLAGDGAIEITDVDGDTLAGSVSGLWINNGSANFVGTIQNMVVTSDDGAFNGTTGVASLVGLTELPSGNIMTIAFGDWFTDSTGAFQDFSGAWTLAQGGLVPEPATLCLLALGALAFARHRRR